MMPSGALSDASGFVLSRIYGQGWNAAKKLMAEESGAALALQLPSLNPYRTGAESARWASGFIDALGSRQLAPSTVSRRGVGLKPTTPPARN